MPAPILASMRTSARRSKAAIVLNGAKMFITNGVHGDIYFVAAKTGDPGRSRQISMFVVEKGMPGFRVARAAQEARLAVAATPPSWCSRTASCRTRICSARRTAASMRWCKNLQNERLVIGAQAIGEAMKAHRDHARLGQAAPGVRRVAVGESGHPPAPGDARCRSRGRARAAVQHRLARYAKGRTSSRR